MPQAGYRGRRRAVDDGPATVDVERVFLLVLRLPNLAHVLNQIAEQGGAADAAVEAAPAEDAAEEAPAAE